MTELRRRKEHAMHQLGLKDIVSDHVTIDEVIDPKLRECTNSDFAVIKQALDAHLSAMHSFQSSCKSLSTLAIYDLSLVPSLERFGSSLVPKAIDHCVVVRCDLLH